MNRVIVTDLRSLWNNRVTDLRSLWNNRDADIGGRSNMNIYYSDFSMSRIPIHMASVIIKRHLSVDIDEI